MLLKFVGENLKPIEDGAKVLLQLTVKGKTLYTKEFNFCEHADKFNLKCPVAPGKQKLDWTIAVSNEIPSFLPLDFRLAFKSADGTVQFCRRIEVQCRSAKVAAALGQVDKDGKKIKDYEEEDVGVKKVLDEVGLHPIANLLGLK